MAADAGVVDYMDIGLPVQVAPVSTLLQQALTPASEGHCVVALNLLGELVGDADPTDILGALTVADYTEAKSAIAGPG